MSAAAFFFSALTKMILLVNPLYALPAYLSLTASCSEEDRRSVAIKSCVFAAALWIFFAILGNWFLSMVGISHGAFRLGGGILLFTCGYFMVTGPSTSEDTPEKETSKPVKSKKNVPDVSIFPLGFPLITGPGIISVTVGLIAETPNTLPFQVAMIGAIGVIVGTIFVSMLFGPVILKMLGTAGAAIMQRICGLLIVCIAIQMITSGIGQAVIDFQKTAQEQVAQITAEQNPVLSALCF